MSFDKALHYMFGLPLGNTDEHEMLHEMYWARFREAKNKIASQSQRPSRQIIKGTDLRLKPVL